MNNTANADDKLDSIENLSLKIEDSIEKLLDLCGDENEEIRYRALGELQNVKSIETESMVYKSLEDPDELVRATGLETLGYWKEKKAEDIIFVSLTDKSPLVRSAAAISLGQIGSKKYFNKIIKMIETADSEDRIGLFYYLCIIGRNEYLSLFLNGLFDSFYRTRCATANLLIDLVDQNNINFLLNFLNLVNKEEKMESVRSSIKSAISKLTDRKQDYENQCE